MASVLKSQRNDVRGVPNAPAGLAGFNFEDLSERAKVQLEAWDQEWVRLRQQAIREADSIREAARAEGLRLGRQEAAEEAAESLRQQVESRLSGVLSASDELLSQIAALHQNWLDQYAETLIGTAVAIAERVVRQRLHDEPEILVRWAEDALWAARSAARLTVAVHPETLAELGPQLDELLARPGLPEEVTIIPDEGMPREGVCVRQVGGEVVATLRGQLERLSEVLGDA